MVKKEAFKKFLEEGYCKTASKSSKVANEFRFVSQEADNLLDTKEAFARWSEKTLAKIWKNQSDEIWESYL